MKKVEIKKLDVVSVFKVSMYLLAIPIAIFALIGIIMMAAGIVMEEYRLALVGGAIGIGYPLFFALICGPLYMLMAFIYNILAQRMGGLVMTISEKEDTIEQL